MTTDKTFLKAITAHQEGKLGEAAVFYKEILKAEPTKFEAYNNLGALLYTLTKLDEAEINLKKAIELKHDFPEAYNNLGNVQKSMRKFNEAKKSYKLAIGFKPDYVDAHYNLGILLGMLNEHENAAISYKRTIELKNDHIDAYNNLGGIMKDLNRLDKAEAIFNKVIKFNPNYVNAYKNLAITQYLQKKLAKSSANYDLALTQNPDLDYLLGSSIHAKMHLCKWNDFSIKLSQLTKKINDGKKAVTPFVLLTMIDDPEIQKKCAEIYSNDRYPISDILPKISHYHNHKKIKIGYFSSDFWNHPTSFLTAELYEIHDREKFEIHAFSFGIDIKDEFNIRIKQGVDHFHDVHLMSDFDIVKFARSLEIDIAIDLKGYTGRSRPNIFAMLAAPIQVSYLGYPGTMGANYIDYIIADHSLTNSKEKNYYSEKIVYMPNSYQANLAKKNIFEIQLSRKDVNLPESSFVFCCFNNNYKITPVTFAGWMRILKATDNSILWLYVSNIEAIDNLRQEAIKHGVNKNRLIFAQYKPNEEHLKRIQVADLFLDTLPCNGHTTTSDALKMGLPVLTFKGRSFAGRVAASLLNAVQLPEMITTSQTQYESLAIELAKNPFLIILLEKYY